MRCGKCKFFLQSQVEHFGEESLAFGYCHRYPVPTEKTEIGWCGEYNAAKAEDREPSLFAVIEGIESAKSWINKTNKGEK